MSVIRYKVDSRGLLTEHPEGSLVAYSNLAAIESKLDDAETKLTQCAKELHSSIEARIEQESRLDATLGALKEVMRVSFSQDGAYQIAEKVWKENVVERQSPQTLKQYIEQQIQACDDMQKLTAADLNKRV